MDSVLELLRPLTAPRFTMTFWPSTGTWGLSIFEGGTQLAAADEPTVDAAVASLVEQMAPKEEELF